MSIYCNPQRMRNLYDPAGTKPFAISRSKIALFIECPRSFFLDGWRSVSECLAARATTSPPSAAWSG